MVAPVALYPDALLAQVLVASTFPLQVVKADRLVDDSEGMTDEEMNEAIAARGVRSERPGPAFGLPDRRAAHVRRPRLDRGARRPPWSGRTKTCSPRCSGCARRRRPPGYLTSNEAHTVEEDDDQIYITPTDPEVVYVPTYDPTVVYTSPPTAQPVIVTPQQQATNPLANPFLAGALGFGGALLVQELFGDDDDDDNDDGWDDYWRRPRPIDYDDRQFYPRPRYGADYAWARERNSSWDRNRGAWQYNAEARRQYDKDRHDTASWLMATDPRSGKTRASLVRERQKLAVEQARREQRWADERRNDRRKANAMEERKDAVKREVRQDARADEARKARREQARREENQKAQSEQARKRENAQQARQPAKQDAARQKANAKEKQSAQQRDQAKRDEARQNANAEKAREEKRLAADKAKAAQAKEDAAKAEARKDSRKAEEAKAANENGRASKDKAAAQEQRVRAEQAAKSKAAAESQQSKASAQERAAKQKAAADAQKAQSNPKKKKCDDDDKNCKKN